MKLLAVGSVAYDSIKTPYGEVNRVMGGAATFFSLAASFFTEPAVVAVVGDDYGDAQFQVFLEKGIDIRLIQRQAGASFFWKGEYGPNLNEAKTLATELNVFAGFTPGILPEYRQTPYLFLGNIHPDLQNHVLDQMTRPRLVVLDTMNYWIQNTPSELARVLSRVDILLLNEGEARQLSGEYQLLKTMRRIGGMGPHTVVIKRGEYGAAVWNRNNLFLVPAFPVENLCDPTGCGDSFAGGFVGYLAGRGECQDADLRRAVLYGTVMASFKIEAFSVERLRSLTFPEIQERFDRFHAMIAV